MSDIIIQVEELSKKYRLGTVGTNTLKGDLQNWFYKKQGKEERLGKIGQKTTDGEIWALRNIDFNVQQGEVLGIIGKNGAGKSTILKILSRITTPTSGSIKIKGRIASLLEVGTGFHRELTGRENIYLNGAILGMHRHEIRQKLDEIIAFSGVEQYIDTPVKRYSSGMYVRLAFAVAAHLEPEILVVDEVLAVGDAEFQRKAIGKMQDVSAKQGRTVLFVSHNMTLVRRLCSRALVVERGSIGFSGETGEAIQFYLEKLSQDIQTNASERRGSGKVRLQKIEVKSEKSTNIQIGEDVLFCFSFSGEIDFTKDKLEVDFRIDNEWGDRVLWLSSRLIDYKIQSTAVQFRIPKCPLTPGKYYITLYAELNHESADWIENACSFIVHEGDFYGTGRKVPPMQTNLWVDFEVE